MKPKPPPKKGLRYSGSDVIAAMLAEPQVPKELRVQIFRLMEHSFGRYSDIGLAILPDDDLEQYRAWDRIVERYEYKKGLRRSEMGSEARMQELIDQAKLKDLVTIIRFFLEEATRQYSNPAFTDTMKYRDGVEEINRLFKERKIEYKFSVDEAGKAHAADTKSTYLYKETIAKTTSLLSSQEFQGPLEEFEIAIDDFSKGDNKDAIHHAHQALDGTMDAILDKLGYIFDPYKLGKNKKPNAAQRIEALIEKGVIHKSLDALFKSAGTPRNLAPGAGHTQGLTPKSLEPSCAGLELHLCGTLIVYLIERYEEYVNN